ncbi:uncharacterized protein I206_107286 [Kwoniella pini CBS 10737]|uniref:Major facilitator superfamily (MFS) profile domain-containing protein n=1 Tax=Kwoniella pini CBS 10737 TaxID=1296096 RepID=A0A1B9HYN7_9TREE|nr:uncharacterized protein I206_05169 [Kwoniella pini CBS 10737]OCF48392.1 hypothetical protein I206_05169 [Kwoniella pini CBS 10737]
MLEPTIPHDLEKSRDSSHSSSTAAELSKNEEPESPLRPPYRSKYLDSMESPSISDSEHHDTFDSTLTTSRPRAFSKSKSPHIASSSQTYQSGGDLSRMVSGLSRMSSRQANQLESDLRRHISIHGKRRHSAGIMEDRAVVDLGNGEEEVIIVDWIPDDPDNPFNWHTSRKYAILLTCVFITFTGAASLVSVGILSQWGPGYFDVSREVFLLQLTLPMMAIAFTPMVLAPLSELIGRNMIYQITSVVNLLLFIPQCLSKNHNGILTARFFQGMASSVGNSMVGGTVADMFYPRQRGIAMGVFSVMIFCAQGSGIPAVGWIGQNLGMRWSYIILTVAAALNVILNAIVLRETRADVLLSRRAKKLTKKTGKKHLCAADLQKTSFLTMMRISLIRPFQYLITEPIVTALSAWIGFAWSCVFIFGSSVILVFEAYGFNPAQAASFEVTLAIAAFIGFACQFHQDHLYRKAAKKNNGKAPPEARLYWAAYGGLMFPLFCFIYAWTARAGVVHWAVPAVCLVGCYTGIFMMYTGVFTYLADAYEIYSSSAQASQSFIRNLFSGLFPLFSKQMYQGMGYQYASTLVAVIALILAAAPFLLIIYGKKLRKRSKVCSTLYKED